MPIKIWRIRRSKAIVEMTGPIQKKALMEKIFQWRPATKKMEILRMVIRTKTIQTLKIINNPKMKTIAEIDRTV